MLKFIRSVINSIIIVIVVGLSAVFLLPRVFGYQPYMVVSASMQQVFPVGSLIFVKEVSPEEVKVGDPVTFTSGTLTITHRVVSINKSAQIFTTKGDNNSASEQIPFGSVKGRALEFSVPYMGYFAAWFITPNGRIITLAILISMAALSMVFGRIIKIKDEEKQLLSEAAQPTEAAEAEADADAVPAEAVDKEKAEYADALNELNEILIGEKKEGETS